MDVTPPECISPRSKRKPYSIKDRTVTVPTAAGPRVSLPINSSTEVPWAWLHATTPRAYVGDRCRGFCGRRVVACCEPIISRSKLVWGQMSSLWTVLCSVPVQTHVASLWCVCCMQKFTAQKVTWNVCLSLEANSFSVLTTRYRIGISWNMVSDNVGFYRNVVCCKDT